MISQDAKKILSVALSFVLVTTSSQILYGYQTANSPPPADNGNPTDPAPQSAAELQSLVAPIALYPDALVAQILTASTFPDQIAISNYWMQQNKSLTGSALMQAVNTQSWDASIKALTEFPSVLTNLANNLTWTSSLGERLIMTSRLKRNDRDPDVAGASQISRQSSESSSQDHR